jgi:dihydrofolate synthase/folylpolyglutamate synthase
VAAVALRRACRQVGAACQTIPPLAGEWPLALAGAHQRQNAALAVAAARTLASVDDQAIRHGLRRLRWPGRFEVVSPQLVLDGAHNGASAAALAATLAAFAGPGPGVFVIGINRDKDARGVLRPLLPRATAVWATQTADNPRALPAPELAAVCRRLGQPAHVQPDLGQALHEACEAAARSGAVVCVTGSLLLVGQARATLGLDVPETLW